MYYYYYYYIHLVTLHKSLDKQIVVGIDAVDSKMSCNDCQTFKADKTTNQSVLHMIGTHPAA